MSTSALAQVLRDYAVPMQVWFAPHALKMGTDPLIDTLSQTVQVNTHPLESDPPQGPAVLVLSAEDFQGARREALLDLARRAHPGRSVLLGGTSDRDVLMDAINTLGVIRVVETGADTEAMLSAVIAAGEYLRREVALTSAIDDLDIENSLLDSVIFQHQAPEAENPHDRDATLITLSKGLAHTLGQDKAALQALADTRSDGLLQRALRGIDALATVMEQVHDRCTERAAGQPSVGVAVDPLVEAAAQLCAANAGNRIDTHLGCTERTDVDPFALTHLIVHLYLTLPQATGIDTHAQGRQAVIEISTATEIPAGYPGLATATEPVATSWSVLRDAGVVVSVGDKRVKIQLPGESP
jgi:hypothetical protein